MTIRKILPKTQLSLHSTSRVTDFKDVYVKKAIRDLLDTLANHQLELDQKYPGKGMGVGLAANQMEYPSPDYPSDFTPPNIYIVSIRPERARLEGCSAVAPTVYVNASFVPVSDVDSKPHQISYEEGCLSISGIKGLFVPRFNEIRLKAFDPFGRGIDLIVKGFTARVHQHEIDHGFGEEYLNRMEFSLKELYLIQDWIEQFRKKKIDRLPCFIIPNRLECIDTNPDVDALEVWVKNEIKKKEFKERSISQNNFRFTKPRLNLKDSGADSYQFKAKL